MSGQQLINEFLKFSETEKRAILVALENTLTEQPPVKKRSLLELSGLGKEVWKGINVDEYIRNERNWDRN
jgi:hypothetical protein